MSENTDTTPETVDAPVNLTAYTAAKVANFVFAQAGFEYEIKPQAMYGLRKTIGVDEDGKLIGSSFKTWLDKKLEQLKNGEVTSERGDYEELAKQFMTPRVETQNEDQELVDGVTDDEAELNELMAEEHAE
jgi:hypothetical protein